MANLSTPITADVEDVNPKPATQPRHGRAGRIGLLTLLLGFGGFIAWALLAPLDEGVVAPSTVAIDTKRKPVQHLSGGIVREVLVREGQWVWAGLNLAGQVVAGLVAFWTAYAVASFR